MILHLAAVMSADDVAALRDALADPALFDDGRRTAGWAAAAVKNNRQARPGGRARTLAHQVERALQANEVFAAYARPKAFVRTQFSRYGEGMAYGAHVDDALMGGQRTDLSFTLFLSDPQTYDGGDLVIETEAGDTRVKMAAGEAVVYPTGALHRVEPVTAGERLAAVGWVRSFVRRADQRDVLFDLEIAARGVHGREGKSDTFDRLAKARANLVRMWAED
ncbi:Fe2+-dependent dioxygenase [Rhodothalassium salexigens]|uniref:Fe2+-dependent dioxygenase n=1 Tax=Rhodothalassium salexigens TaxID=1086 RepID=UPI0019125B50|nr:Fe2+-dependent dioxygenase [Rhodothalassium salexigens]MBK5911208.1 Fe2+-dependent dioxygenase [Rhodothalassium salexigens]MBK5919896.1 Fe2+-dependent dioxygenase [Rhodothalassium salexigens]